ncbi:MAG: endonuclease 4 [Candidatus Moanabacter tarae]|uniref:Endonuclease 4 n=1 Tax=Candidatus Moanibacter tarae TaxID=2200854 RepID=A0A2Z4AAP5_9BACT|nr:MAG: endonuclease 4 [Candidatus Moanabacter tarae]|tara:strand:- start:8220 stop:9089 length:870 start_codon:yes stop_codon:yes gene_type:complete
MGKNWKWATTGFGLTSKTHDQIIELCGVAGLDGIEGTVPLFKGLNDSQLGAVAIKYQNAGIKIETFHLPFSLEDDITSFYETIRRRAVETCRTWMERSTILGATIGIQHPGTNRLNVDLEGIDNYMRQLEKSLKELLPAAEQLNLTLALENLPPGENGPRLGSRPEHFERFSKAFRHPNLGFVLDTGHALMSGDSDAVDEFHKVMAPYMVAYHLADNAGDRDSHLAPGHGLVDWGMVFKRAAEIGYSGCMCIETAPFAPGPNGTYSDDAWKQMVEDTEVLVVEALGSES